MLDQLGAISMLSTAVPFLENRKKDSKKTRFFFCARAHRRRPSHVTPARQRGNFFFWGHFSFKKFNFSQNFGKYFGGENRGICQKMFGPARFSKFSEIFGNRRRDFRNFPKSQSAKINVFENPPQ